MIEFIQDLFRQFTISNFFIYDFSITIWNLDPPCFISHY